MFRGSECIFCISVFVYFFVQVQHSVFDGWVYKDTLGEFFVEGNLVHTIEIGMLKRGRRMALSSIGMMLCILL